MEHREEKTAIQKILAKYEIQRVKVASGDTFTKKSPSDRFECSVNWTETEKSGDFDHVVKYFHDHKICIVWQVEGRRPDGSIVRRSKYSVDANEVLTANCRISYVKKNIEHKGHEKEPVYIVAYDKFEEFVKEMKWRKEA